jgi:hypothetical protein
MSRKIPAKRIRPSHNDILLLIEVADSSAQQDLEQEARLYAKHGIPECRIVDVQTEQVHMHQNPHEDLD